MARLAAQIGLTMLLPLAVSACTCSLTKDDSASPTSPPQVLPVPTHAPLSPEGMQCAGVGQSAMRVLLPESSGMVIGGLDLNQEHGTPVPFSWPEGTSLRQDGEEYVLVLPDGREVRNSDIIRDIGVCPTGDGYEVHSIESIVPLAEYPPLTPLPSPR